MHPPHLFTLDLHPSPSPGDPLYIGVGLLKEWKDDQSFATVHWCPPKPEGRGSERNNNMFRNITAENKFESRKIRFENQDGSWTNLVIKKFDVPKDRVLCYNLGALNRDGSLKSQVQELVQMKITDFYDQKEGGSSSSDEGGEEENM